ncbi:iron-sulfur cluster assembly accessory protein [Pseudomaricurvus sp. HS19]|uniref:HesB/IscA family protein n=1 Tax=Pseudomaricurvus sp. HS19 TaxID=2692626 RepID=UPI0013719DDC|nr:iron-sulfur cluster assembly accessory protein [Pseudomaricurvus sp. HS19]MYM63003.1 iron-sulfur cluster assembly accessory protein [Pseudomaricurvus sp. HS19]
MNAPQVFDPSAPAVTLTAAALRHFESKLAAQPGKILRLFTETSGCTGYAYRLDFADAPEASDEVLHPGDKVTLAIADDALQLVRGTEIDMVTEGINRVVKFNNPNVVAECGCGESFSVS